MVINQNSINWALRGRFKIDGDGIIFWPNFHDNTFFKESAQCSGWCARLVEMLKKSEKVYAGQKNDN